MLIKRLKDAKDPFSNFQRLVFLMGQAYRSGKKRKAVWLRDVILRRYACCISPLAVISESAEFPHPVGIVIGDGAKVGAGCVIYQNVTLGRIKKEIDGYPTLKERCIVYSGAVVVGSITLEEDTIVAANAVVTKGTTRSGEILAGVPARSKRNTEE